MTISSRHICTSYRKVPRCTFAFHFGNSEHVRYRDIMGVFKNVLTIEDGLGSRSEAVKSGSRLRDIVLVGHGMQTDLAVLGELGLDVQDELQIVAVVDTRRVAEELMGLDFASQGPSLVNLLKHLGCPAGRMHNAGNDAAFTMRAMLALALETRWPGPQIVLGQFRKLAYARLKIPDVLRERKIRGLDDEKVKQRDRKKRQDRENDWANVLENQLSVDEEDSLLI